MCIESFSYKNAVRHCQFYCRRKKLLVEEHNSVEQKAIMARAGHHHFTNLFVDKQYSFPFKMFEVVIKYLMVSDVILKNIKYELNFPVCRSNSE